MNFDKIIDFAISKLKEQGFVVLLLLGISYFLWQENRKLHNDFIEYLKTENDQSARDSFMYDILKEEQ